jgi:hypothetical protein
MKARCGLWLDLRQLRELWTKEAKRVMREVLILIRAAVAGSVDGVTLVRDT